MNRLPIVERPEWRAQAESFGFSFHTMYGEPYWCEDAYYQFTLRQIDELEDASNELHQMALEAVQKVVDSEALLAQFGLPEASWDVIKTSWANKEPSLYGRFDFAYDGIRPPKLLEYNADTPTSLFETALFQWLWLEEQQEAGLLPREADQFNSIQEQLIARFKTLKQQYGMSTLSFASCFDSVEDRGTVQYLQDCAEEAGMAAPFLFIEDIGLNAQGQFTDYQDQNLDALFKLYPWEFMLREDFAPHLKDAPTRWLEPAWKSILSNKALLPLLWQLFPYHPYLLAAYFEGDKQADKLSRYVRKPLFSREGANIEIIDRGQTLAKAEGPYGAEGYIVQEYYPLPKFGDSHTLVGSWMVGDEACGLCIREDHSLITQDLSRFYPHVILN